MELVKGKVLKSAGGTNIKLVKGEVVTLPADVAADLQRAGYFEPEAETTSSKKAAERETVTAKNSK